MAFNRSRYRQDRYDRKPRPSIGQTRIGMGNAKTKRAVSEEEMKERVVYVEKKMQKQMVEEMKEVMEDRESYRVQAIQHCNLDTDKDKKDRDAMESRKDDLDIALQRCYDDHSSKAIVSFPPHGF